MRFIGVIGLVVLGLLLTLGRRGTGGETGFWQVTNPSAASGGSPLRLQSARIGKTSSPELQLHESLLAEMASEMDPDRRSEWLERVAESVSDAALVGVLDSLVALDTTGAADLRALLVRRWAQSDAPAAAAWAVEISGGSARREAMEQVSVAWANTDLAGATAWLKTLPDDEGRQTATLGVAYEAARSEPLAAIELARQLLPTAERDDLFVHAVSQWASADVTTAADWAGKILEPELQKRLLSAVALASAVQNPAGAATLIANLLAAGESQDRAAVAILQRWAQSSPFEAAAWVAQFPEIPSREAAVQNLVTIWTAQAPADAANWLNEMPEGPLRNLGVNAYTQALTPTIVTESEE